MKKIKPNQNLSDKLKKYSTMGAAFMLTAPAAQAAVVFTDVNPDQSFGVGGGINIDIDGDGTDDVRVQQNGSTGGASIVSATPLNGASLMGTESARWAYPFALASGATISAGQTFSVTGSAAGNTGLNSYSNYGFWTGGNVDAYIGVRFDIAGNTHFGYVHLEVVNSENFILKDYGYEDTPNTAIAAGATVTVPTLSEWGLITLSLFLMSFGTIFVAKREGALGMAGGTADMGGLSWVFRRPPFFAAAFKKALLATGVLTALLGLFSIVAYGGITAVDFFGAMVAAPVFAYLMHLMMVYEKETKKIRNGER